MTRRAVVRTLRRCGWAVPAALGLLAAAGVLAGLATPQWTADADTARANARRLRTERAEAARRRDAPASAAIPPDAWPDASRAGDRAADLLEQALRSGVVVERTQQRLDRSAGSGVHAVRLQQSVRAAYADARRLAGAAMLADPALGLERLRLQRGGASAAEFEGELHWALVQRSTGGPR